MRTWLWRPVQEYDATVLLKEKGPFPFSILVDQGTADKFLAGGGGVGFGWCSCMRE
jgi:hypothetical protein